MKELVLKTKHEVHNMLSSLKDVYSFCLTKTDTHNMKLCVCSFHYWSLCIYSQSIYVSASNAAIKYLNKVRTKQFKLLILPQLIIHEVQDFTKNIFTQEVGLRLSDLHLSEIYSVHHDSLYPKLLENNNCQPDVDV